MLKQNTQPCSHTSVQSCTQRINFTTILYFKVQALLDPTWTSGIWNENSVNMGQSFHCIQLVYKLKYHAIQISISGAVSHSIFSFLVFQLPLMTHQTTLVQQYKANGAFKAFGLELYYHIKNNERTSQMFFILQHLVTHGWLHTLQNIDGCTYLVEWIQLLRHY